MSLRLDTLENCSRCPYGYHLAINLTGRNDPNRTDIWPGFSEKKIRSSWDKTRKGIEKCMKFVTGTMKWDSDSWLPSVIALIPLINIMSSRSLKKYEVNLARKWLTLACLHGLFSGLGYSEIDRIARGLSKEKTVRKLYTMTKRSLGRVEPNHFNTGRRNGPAMSLLMTLLRTGNAKDWGASHDSLDGSVMGHNAELQIHHFFPKECLMKHGINDQDMINTLANYVIIHKDTNLKFLDSEPIKYLRKNGVRRRDLTAQFIPLDEELWRVSNYRRFLRVRREMLAKAANQFLSS